MKKLLLIALSAGIVTSCNGQEHSSADLAQNDAKPKTEKPKGNWTVNKEVDEDGNLIKYDSTYVYSSSDDLKGLNSKEMDSVMNSYTQRFEQHFYSSANGNMPEGFVHDSIFKDDMFKEFFRNESGNVSDMMQQMQEHMQAMQAQLQQNNAIIPVIPEENREKPSKKE